MRWDMSLGLRNAMSVNMTVVSNEFIDTYMAAANGEYVKVYLYLLRNERANVTVSDIADALNHTEADVKRALAYWRELGVLAIDEMREPNAASDERSGKEEMREAVSESAVTTAYPALGAVVRTTEHTIPDQGNRFERMQKLSDDGEFSALLYAVQQYLGKTFTQIECEKFAYFYDGLKMSADLLEYLAEYCAGGGHSSIRYIEKVALNWYQMGIKTREEAKDYTLRYSKDMSSVMKAFGITNRNPGTAELEFMKKWFKEYGFDCALVTEACNRTITATGSASFPYADRILTGWKEQGVRMMSDVEELDKRHQMVKPQQDKYVGRNPSGSRAGGAKATGQKNSGNNRFNNFEQRNYDYENLVWEGMRKRQKGGTGDGTQ